MTIADDDDDSDSFLRKLPPLTCLPYTACAFGSSFVTYGRGDNEVQRLETE